MLGVASASPKPRQLNFPIYDAPEFIASPIKTGTSFHAPRYSYGIGRHHAQRCSSSIPSHSALLNQTTFNCRVRHLYQPIEP
ncbi:hypothetical protein K402DRAFT_50193 [Aulographum hederae CBS 113979]|uniref:Uncharacterized protein n=1 Tax=Aulographum hederae CBS 113979 TaxID=1176131 RepID=A0A6G1H361_9PEZI|nr:hypothetical protein K402DRAFT_50193 [Aulographum hederae CBS 113979]